MENYEEDIESITLIPSDGEVYEVTVNDKLVFSKKQTQRHAEPGEVEKIVGELLKKG